jgi:hypothetical protein
LDSTPPLYKFNFKLYENNKFCIYTKLVWTVYVRSFEEISSTHIILVRISEGERQLGKLDAHERSTFKIDLQEIRCDGAGWIHRFLGIQ